MKTLRVCVGSNDGTSVAQTHMGDTLRFSIHDVSEDQRTTHIGDRKNTAVDLDHAGADKMKIIVQILDDVDLLVAAKNSPNFRRIAASTKHQPVLLPKVKTIQQALASIGYSFQQAFDLVTERRNGKRVEDVPMLPVVDGTGMRV
ncbi:MAG: hypothetical protein JXM79_00635 [Sedimentisphaerales bacterium]|nr:hypothetical protein [Sedimentisphaerales bacterium]